LSAQLKPLLTTRTEYIGYRHVSRDEFDQWVELNVDVIANRFFQSGGTDLDKLAAFAASEWEKERGRREDYARTLVRYE
jgi:hypothetical protein